MAFPWLWGQSLSIHATDMAVGFTGSPCGTLSVGGNECVSVARWNGRCCTVDELVWTQNFAPMGHKTEGNCCTSLLFGHHVTASWVEGFSEKGVRRQLRSGTSNGAQSCLSALRSLACTHNIISVSLALFQMPGSRFHILRSLTRCRWGSRNLDVNWSTGRALLKVLLTSHEEKTFSPGIFFITIADAWLVIVTVMISYTYWCEYPFLVYRFLVQMDFFPRTRKMGVRFGLNRSIQPFYWG